MGFCWHVRVKVAYVQEIQYINSFSRLATRCLKLREGSQKRKRVVKKPGEPILDKEVEEPFSEDEDDMEMLKTNPRHLELYERIKKCMYGDHAADEEISCYVEGESLVNECFQVAVERILPGNGKKFALRFETHGGAYGEPGSDANYEFAYVEYVPSSCDAGSEMSPDRGEINIPWGAKMTPVCVLDQCERNQVDAAFAVLMHKLGLEKVDQAGLKLVSFSSGG